MKIRKLQLKNIGPFDDETIEFQEGPKDKAEIHIFTGENGTGKTTLLMALANSFGPFPFDDSLGGKSNYPYVLYEDYENYLSPNFFSRWKLGGKLTTVFDEASYPTEIEFPANFQYKVSHDVFKYSKLLVNANNWILNMKFAAFAYSGYRQLQSRKAEALHEPNKFNPLSQSLNFIKDYGRDNQITVNQLIANNISKSAIEKSRNRDKSKRFAKVLSSMEHVLNEITGWQIEFDMQTEPVNLVTKVNGKELDFDALPDGLRSLISWIADLLGRVDLLKWEDDLPITEKNLILFLDEIEVQLHPAWQRKVLPVVQKLFKNSQIFLSTHSPFVVNSVDDAWVYKLEVEDGKARVADVVRSEDGWSYRYVLRNTFGIDKEFGVEVEQTLKDFYELRDKFLSANGNKQKVKKDLIRKAKELAEQTKELKTKMDFELFQLSEMSGEDFSL